MVMKLLLLGVGKSCLLHIGQATIGTGSSQIKLTVVLVVPDLKNNLYYPLAS